MHKRILFGLVPGIVLVAGAASAQYPPAPPPPPTGAYYPPAPPRAHFGNPGVLAFTSDMNVAFVGQSTSLPNNTGDNPSQWTLTLRPSADYFIIQGLSLGGFVEYTHNNFSTPNQNGPGSTSTSSDTFGIGPRVGYNIPFTDAISWWPLAGFAFSTTSASGGAGSNAFTLLLYAPFLYHPVSHFFMGIGPVLATDVAANATPANGGQSGPGPKVTTYGLQFTIGGWFLTG
jgi:hypothetical protein